MIQMMVMCSLRMFFCLPKCSSNHGREGLEFMVFRDSLQSQQAGICLAVSHFLSLGKVEKIVSAMSLRQIQVDLKKTFSLKFANRCSEFGSGCGVLRQAVTQQPKLTQKSLCRDRQTGPDLTAILLPWYSKSQDYRHESEFFVLMFYNIYFFMHVNSHMCQGACLEVSGQLLGVVLSCNVGSGD